jgi:hypothetical protein
VAGKAALWLLAPTLAWGLGLISAEEKQAVREMLRLGLARLRRPREEFV